MSSSGIFYVEGLDRISDVIGKIGNAPQLFDNDFARNARMLTRDMLMSTPKKTGNTSRGWSIPKRIGDSSYIVSNEITVQGATRRYNLAWILDSGRGAVKPVIAKKLYIPLSNKGMSKRAGAPIPKGLIFGKDYVLAKQSKPTKPANYIRPQVLKNSRTLLTDMIRTIRSTIGQNG